LGSSTISVVTKTYWAALPSNLRAKEEPKPLNSEVLSNIDHCRGWGGGGEWGGGRRGGGGVAGGERWILANRCQKQPSAQKKKLTLPTGLYDHWR